MGRRKKEAAQMGKAIIKDRFRGKSTPRGGESFLHTTQMNDGIEWGTLNLQSVTEQTSLDDFLTTAELAGRDFTAEKENVKIVTNSSSMQLNSKEKLQKIKAAQDLYKNMLRIPRRPPWTESTPADKLKEDEHISFLEWRRQLGRLQEEEHIVITPYEKNLEFWRQLWRVIERSDVVVQIVDARNPLLFWCPDLDKYVKEVDKRKQSLLLINKADYLSLAQRQAWASYFSAQGVSVVFWSAKDEAARLQQSQENDNDGNGDGDNSDNDDNGSDFDDDINNSESDENGDVESNKEVEDSGEKDEDAGSDKLADNTSATHTNADSDNVEHDHSKDDARSDKQTDVQEAQTDRGCDNKQSKTDTNTPQEEEEIDDDSDEYETEEEYTDDEADPDDVGISHGKTSGDSCSSCNAKNTDADATMGNVEQCQEISHELHNSEELLALFRRTARMNFMSGVTTIGMVGYPNVGKSSTINTILQTKKVPVSATPGRTKHFQTLYVEKDLMLCDCPGLVFPSFVNSKAELVVNGILPIDQLMDCEPPVTLVCDRLGREVLEGTYHINLPPPEKWEDPDKPPSAYDLLHAYGLLRGFMSHKGNPDRPRAARYILKDYVNGRLLFCHPPPGIDAAAFQKPPYAEPKVYKTQPKPSTKKTVSEMKTEALDREFFAKRHVKAHAIGPRAVQNYVRTEAFRQIGTGQGQGQGDVSGASTPYGSQASLVGKPWKKHNNRNKKEKLRRVYAEHDYQYH